MVLRVLRATIATVNIFKANIIVKNNTRKAFTTRELCNVENRISREQNHVFYFYSQLLSSVLAMRATANIFYYVPPPYENEEENKTVPDGV